MGFYEAVATPAIATVVHGHFQFFTMVLSHRLVRRDIAVTPTIFLATPRPTRGVVENVFSTIRAIEAAYDDCNLSHVSFTPYVQSVQDILSIGDTVVKLFEQLNCGVPNFQD